ncbi:MAG: serine protease [Verrucomicrobia bacterium]|nr:serine protease [Verrucomicrobiota bacterium]
MKTSLPVILLLAAALSSCQTLDSNGATRHEKTAALAAHLAAWQPDLLVNQFAQPRTVQLLSNPTLDPANRRLDAASTGQATLLTPDGYALTAAHVLQAGPVSVLRLRSPRPGQLALTSAGPVFFSPGKPERPTRLAIADLEALPIRLVHRFRGTDLALVKLPLNTAHTFQLADAPPPPGSTLFSYGSNLSGNSSAGETLHLSRARSLSPAASLWHLDTSIPLQKGDSGGPVMDASGTLVGIVSRGRTDLLANRITSTVAVGISPSTLRKLIDADRLNP